ncbi:GNAT family N-acetyltransferase [Microbacterium sp. zg.B48]|uniref:GNAT family N-acetyltransferase n=1 Tax=unclassified Microbacterium TaxID=2609290 RepID=UPI00214CEC94|nr:MULTISPECIES: GNAT family N-acetyltransferase [unclassified Microbacterium]MCR2763328.1 GNAT family N-acetyltransferase [Microbacterium sp. zg.B48]MCR2809051.1 GNAT family N-acetyltransferase [Microbacterium sp. zg.B185]WIM20207.1 GNAT family N-acetyltransferase [Microbacterium sp. zg-B185]
MAEIVISPATPDRFDDAEYALSGGGDGRACQCQWWMITSAQFDNTTQSERRELLREELHRDAAPPALIAYVDDEAAGWVRVGPRAAQIRLLRTRAIAANTDVPLDDLGVWAISCFVVRREYRGRGLTGKLLSAAIDFARSQGARSIEAYPLDTTAATHRPNELYHGILSGFQRAGFREVARPKPDRTIVSLDLSG